MRRKTRDYAPPSPVPGAQRSVRTRPAATAALSPAMPLRGEPDSRHHRSKVAADRGPPSPVPTSWARSRKGPEPLPGFRRRWRRKEVESFFPAACTAGKIPLTERRAKRVRPPEGAGPFSRPSGVENHRASAPKGRWLGIPSLKCSSVHLSEITSRCIPPSWPCRSRSSPAWRPPQRERAC